MMDEFFAAYNNVIEGKPALEGFVGKKQILQAKATDGTEESEDAAKGEGEGENDETETKEAEAELEQ
jgi:hypothetical protein